MRTRSSSRLARSGQPTSGPAPSKQPTSRLGVALSTVVFLGIALLAPAWGGGCREASIGGDCVGGVVIDGVCQGKCTPDKCAYADNTCVENRCVLKCDAHLDCFHDGTQVCGPATEDDTSAAIFICKDSGQTQGVGVACPVGDECATGLACQSKGEADPTAYCTERDCASDADCLSGYYCGVVRDPHEVCGSNPKKGDSAFCGETMEPCKSPGDGGTSLFEGSLCMLRHSCLKRDQAAPCATDLDCSWLEGQACVDVAGDKRCTRVCTTDAECQADTRCDVPSGAAAGACVPRFGKWIGGKGKFCEPCLSDLDCGDKDSTWACADLADGMRGCFDGSYADTCTTDADCPVSPGGKHGTCLNEDWSLTPGDPLYHHCTLPTDPGLKTASCW
ncbi:MAG: hypothetical protein U0441_14125 [Polyangiaceae bacterium]